MYNERKDRFGYPTMSPRMPYGRSISTIAQTSNPKSGAVTDTEEPMGKRGCDGTIPKSDSLGWGLRDRPLAMVYSPYQFFKNVYSLEDALIKGTIFAELDLPFEGDKRKIGGAF